MSEGEGQSERPRKPRRFRAVYYTMNCRCPLTGEMLRARIGRARALQVAEDGPPYRALELQHLVPEALEGPDVICSYVADEWSGWCFTLKAAYRMRNDGRRGAAPEGEVFVVFVTEGLLITDWGWELADKRDPALPVLHDARIGPAVYRRHGP
jgi:hypothetical protein